MRNLKVVLILYMILVSINIKAKANTYYNERYNPNYSYDSRNIYHIKKTDSDKKVQKIETARKIKRLTMEMNILDYGDDCGKGCK